MPGLAASIAAVPSDLPTPERRLIGDPMRETGLRHVRTFNGRQGRRSELTDERLASFGPRRQLPPGLLDPQAAFGREAPVVLEIGCGHGAAAVAFAGAHPERDLVALDVHVPGLARLMALAEEAGVGGNLRVDREDAVAFLVERVAPAQLDTIHLFFPDPWPKERHRRRRFLRPDTLDLIADRLAPGVSCSWPPTRRSTPTMSGRWSATTAGWSSRRAHGLRGDLWRASRPRRSRQGARSAS